jgi:hypothetical protein
MFTQTHPANALMALRDEDAITGGREEVKPTLWCWSWRVAARPDDLEPVLFSCVCAVSVHLGRTQRQGSLPVRSWPPKLNRDTGQNSGAWLHRTWFQSRSSHPPMGEWDALYQASRSRWL